MSYGDKKKVIPRSKKRGPDPYTARIMKQPSKKRREDELRHAVSHHDVEALEDYEEPDFA